MKYVFQFCRILVFCLIGELLHYLIPLPVPASIYGLVLLLAALKIGIVRLEQVKETGDFLTGIFLVLFIPGAVGIIDSLDRLASSWLPFLIAVIVITAAVMAAAGRMTDLAMGGKRDE